MLRYPSINFDTADFPVYVHEPSAAMREVGCTTCVGRHNPQSTHCSANSTGLDILSLADGLRVFDIATLQPLPGVYVLSDTVMQGQKGTARLQLHH